MIILIYCLQSSIRQQLLFLLNFTSLCSISIRHVCNKIATLILYLSVCWKMCILWVFSLNYFIFIFVSRLYLQIRLKATVESVVQGEVRYFTCQSKRTEEAIKTSSKKTSYPFKDLSIILWELSELCRPNDEFIVISWTLSFADSNSSRLKLDFLSSAFSSA